MKIVITDTSCLILFEKLNRFDILQETFSELMVTFEVANEFGPIPKFISIKKVKNRKQFLALSQILGDKGYFQPEG